MLAAYDLAKDVTLKRLYIETMQDMLTHTPSLVVDDRLKGVLPLLQLNAPEAPATPAPAAAQPGTQAAATPAAPGGSSQP